MIDRTKIAIDTATLASKFRAFIDDDFVIDDADAKRPFECDGLFVYKEMPRLVVMPASTEEVQKAMRLCSDHQVPVVVRGAGTGLSGGALPHPDGVLLSLTRLSRILDIDHDARLAAFSRAFVMSRSARPATSSVCSMHPIRHHRLPARSVAMSQKTPVACTASNTA